VLPVRQGSQDVDISILKSPPFYLNFSKKSRNFGNFLSGSEKIQKKAGFSKNSNKKAGFSKLRCQHPDWPV